MLLRWSLAASAIMFAATIPSCLANPVEPSTKDLINRAAGGGCVSPSQIDLSQSRNLGRCNWQEWTLCTALAAGACFAPCELGG